ncbi:IS3 family transposase, partial [Paraburkholderia sp. CNPSo 3076]
LAQVKAIHTQVKGECGWPRMWKELLTQGVRVGKERVRKLMAQHGIRARWVYLAVIVDLFSRHVVGWSMQPHMKAELVTDALRMAWFRRRPDAGVIVHSDRVESVKQRGRSSTTILAGQRGSCRRLSGHI